MSNELAERLLSGDRRALARVISKIEDEDPEAPAIISELYPHTGAAISVGLTGPPGAGKSSIIAKLIELFREEDKKIGVVSVDPSSPFTKGAILGDRIRLVDHFLDKNVFIRSMGNRGHLGGLAGGSRLAGLAMEAYGMDVLLYETMGVGQGEIEVTSAADTVILCLQPGAGDSVQALKAGALDVLEPPLSTNQISVAVSSALATIQVATENSRTADTVRQRITVMTSRERDILVAMVRGGTSKQIGQRLGLSPRTVEAYRGRVMEKIGAQSLSEAVRLAVAAGLRPAAGDG